MKDFNKKQVIFLGILIVQLLSFLYILTTIHQIFGSIVITFLVLLSEIAVYTPIIFNKKRHFFYICWELQLFFFAFFLIVFNFERTFGVSDPNTVTIAFFAIGILIIEALLLVYIIFADRFIKQILFTLALSTTFIVFLIVAFVMSEGLPAIQENGLVPMVTGTTWQPFYSIETSESGNIQTWITPYSINITLPDDRIYLNPDTEKSIPITLKNDGGLNSTVHLSLQTQNQDIYSSLTTSNITIHPGEIKKINMSLNSPETSTTQGTITAVLTENNQEYTTDFAIITSPYGINIHPDLQYLTAGESEGLFQKSIYSVTNTGLENDTYFLTIDSPEYFKPSLSGIGINWNYTSSSAKIQLQPQETRNITLTPRIISRIDGTHQIQLHIISENHPEVNEEALLLYSYERESYLTIPEQKQFIPEDGTAAYDVLLSGFNYDIYNITIDIEQTGWSFRLDSPTETLLTDRGTASVTLNDTGHANLTLYVTAENPLTAYAEFQITVTNPGSEPTFGILPFIIGTLLTTALALFIAAPVGVGIAIFLAEFTPKKIRKILRPLYELLAGIPSVLYGLWGFLTFGPWIGSALYPLIANSLGQYIGFFSETNHMGRDILTASIILSIMVLPIIITLSEDAIRSVPKGYKEGGFALGATKWQTMRKITVPAASSGIVSSIILGTGRAIGETMAVLMIMQFAFTVPTSIFDSAGTMTTSIAALLGSTFSDTLIRHALFAIGLILFIMIFCLNIIVFMVQKTSEKKDTKPRKTNPLRSRLSSIILLFTLVSSNKTPQKNFKIVGEKAKKKRFTILQDTDKKKAKTKQRETNRPTRNNIHYNHKTFLSNIPDNIHQLKRNELIIKGILAMFAIIVTGFLFFIIGDIVIKGAPGIRPELLFQSEIGTGVEGGFANAITGSLQVVGIGIALAFPLAVGAAIYVQEYAKSNNIFTRIILFTSDTLASTPSIIFGAFGFILFVWYLDLGFSMIAGGLTLGFMVIPLMLRSSIEAIKSIPQEFREGSLALGATKWKTIVSVVIPPAIPMIISGVIISIGRAIGETAAIIFTAGYSTHIASSILRPVATLPNLIYKNYSHSTKYPILGEKVYAAALILIVIVLVLNTIARVSYIKLAKHHKE